MNELKNTSSLDYYPFGMLQPGRKYNASGYRFGFNRKEKDDEIKGIGNHIDYGMRSYDPRIVRFPNVDPITIKYPYLTPYQYASNNPILNVDIDGLEGLAGNMVPGMPGDANSDNIISGSEAKSGFIMLGVVTAAAVVTIAAPEITVASGESGWTMFSALMGDEVAAYSSYSAAATTGTIGAGVLLNESESITLYRGVNSTHPSYNAASKGNVQPRGGSATPLEHNLGNTNSQYTSWTTNPEVATNYALRPSGSGVMLKAEVPKSQTAVSPSLKSVNLIQSPGTIINETEVLVKGSVTGASTTKCQISDW